MLRRANVSHEASVLVLLQEIIIGERKTVVLIA
jgi:hypothetical protein